ncbi:MAG: hypothetical protein ACOVP4_06455 [Bacteriovoracaceae bacterium]
MKSFIQTALVLILALGSISAFACQGLIQERGSNRKIVLCQEGEKAQLKLLEGNKEIKTLDLEVGVASVSDIDSNLKYNRNKRSKSITEGYGDVTYFLARTLNMGMIFLFPITGAVYAGYSLSYLYTLPVDMFSKENIGHKKMEKLVEGRKVKASKKVFAYLAENLF